MSRRPGPTTATTATTPDALAALVEQMAGRLRRFGSRQWREAVDPDGASVADIVHALVVRCAQLEAALDEVADKAAVPPRPRYDAALADQLAVVGRDLADALAAADTAVVAELHDELRSYAARLRLQVEP